MSPSTFFLFGLVAVAVFALLLGLFGVVFSGIMSLVGFLLFKLLPVAFVGYLLYRFIAPNEERTERDAVEGD